MNRRVLQLIAVAVACVDVASAVEFRSLPPSTAENTAPDQLAGQPVDIAPWAYVWRADMDVQKQPEAYFIPRRLDRLDKVYRTAYYTLPKDQLKSLFYKLPDLLEPLPPKPKGQLLTGLLWTGRLADYQVELHWPAGLKEIPPPESVEVRTYPTSFGWFGWTVDTILTNPVVSADRRTWSYQSPTGAKMDSAYDARIDAATEMVAVFCEEDKALDGGKPAVPDIRLTSPTMGVWKRMDLEIEWGFREGTEKADFDGHVESQVGLMGSVSPLPGDKGTKVKGAHAWQSRAARGARRGVIVPLLCASGGRPALDSRITIWTRTGGVTFRVQDLETSPILIAKHGVFVTKAGSGKTARQFAGELAAANLKSVCQMTREHRETTSCEELMQEVRLSTCPPGTALAPLPKVADPPMQVQLPDARWTDAWRAASSQLTGAHMWGTLAFEVGRVAHEMNMIGLQGEADKIYELFLKLPGAKGDGDFSDGNGAFEVANGMRHDMGYSHEGTHPSTGRVLFAMAERYFLTGDKAWFLKHRDRMQAAADWIVRQRTGYLKDIPNRRELFVAGLMPPQMLGDYALPTCDWHWYYVDNALSLQGLQRFADALTEFDLEAGRKYRGEAAAFRQDLRRVVDREAALAPVRLGRDGMYHSYIPRMAYAGGVTGPELGAPQFPECDVFMGGLPLAEPFAALDASDPRMVSTINLMDEMGTSVPAVREFEEIRKKKHLSTEDAWFWKCFVILPKASHLANIYLLQDDVPNFLRFWMNCYAAMTSADGKLWEAWHLGEFTNCTSPDNGTAGWFMENFRNLLTMEDGSSLWVARATPRAWLEQGKKISVKNAPTYFGTLAYEIVSDADHGKITAAIEIPARRPPKSVILRMRHPQAVPIKSVRVNGKRWTRFNKDTEVIELAGLTGTVTVVATYR